MDDKIFELGVGGVVALLIIKEGFAFMTKVKDKSKGSDLVIRDFCDERHGNLEKKVDSANSKLDKVLLHLVRINGDK